MAGELSFFEIGVRDARRARVFYEQLLGWTFHQMQGGAWIETPAGRGGIHDDDPDGGIRVYFGVPDIDVAVARVRELGGEAEEPGPAEEGFGCFSSCRDDQGVRFGLHQDAPTRS